MPLAVSFPRWRPAVISPVSGSRYSPASATMRPVSMPARVGAVPRLHIMPPSRRASNTSWRRTLGMMLAR